MTKIISAEEQAIIDYVESNDSASIDNLNTEINRYTKTARAQMSKKKTTSIQLLGSDIEPQNQIRQSKVAVSDTD